MHKITPMKKNIFCILLLFIYTVGFSQPSVRFKQFYNLSPYFASESYDVMTINSGYIISGITVDSSGGFGYNRLTLIGTDTLGNLLWSKHYGNPSFQYAHYYSTKWVSKKDNFFYLTCPVIKPGDIATSVLIKFDFSGDTIWQKEYTAVENYIVTQGISDTPDSGFIMTGNIADSTFQSLLLLKTDSLGAEQWRKKINTGTFTIQGRSVVYDSVTKKYVIAGLHNPVPTEDTQSFVIVTDSLGNKLLQDNYFTGPDGGSFTSLFISNDNNFVVCGANYTGIPVGIFEKTRAKVVKFDINCNEIWNKDFGDPSILNYFSSIMELPSGEMVMVGQYDSLQDAGIGLHGQFIIQKCDQNGDSVWSRVINIVSGTAHQDVVNSFDLTADGGFVLTGVFYGGSSPHEFFLLKLDSFGCDSIDCQFVSVEEREILEMALKIFPNPASDEINILLEGENINDYEISITNILGEVQKTKIENSKISVEAFSSGLYFITATKENKRFACKFIKH